MGAGVEGAVGGVPEASPEPVLERAAQGRARRDGTRAALPRDRPPAELGSHVVGGGAGEQQRAGFRVHGQRQEAVRRAQEDRRLRDGARGEGPVRVGAHQGPVGRRHRALEQAELQLHPEDAADGVVEPVVRDPPVRQAALHRVAEREGVGRDHDHVDPGADGLGDGRVVVARDDLVDAGPVRDHEPREGELALEHVGQEVLVAVDLAVGRAGERGHHDPGAGIDRGPVRRQEDVVHHLVVAVGHAAVDLVPGASEVPQTVPPSPMKCFAVAATASSDVRSVALEPPDQRAAELGDEVRVLAEALVGPPPAHVLRDRHDRPERPADAGGARLQRRGAADLLDEGGVVGRPEADLVREDRRPDDVALAVDRVDAVQDRDPEPRPERGLLVRVDHRVPRVGIVGDRVAVAAAQDAADARDRPRSRGRSSPSR